MFGLNFGKNIFVGIDIGTSSIKIVELKIVGGKPTLSNYAWMPFSNIAGSGEEGSKFFESAFPIYLKRIMERANFKGKEVHISIPAFGGLITPIDFPEMSKEEMEQAIRFEAQKYIPTSLDEVVLSWDILESPKDNSPAKENTDLETASDAASPANAKRMQVLLVAASRSKVERYEKLVRAAGLKLLTMEIESFSLVRSLVGQDPGNFIIVDIGARICNIILVEKGIIKANRNIDAGGKDITRSVANSMNIDEARAEKLKLSNKNFFAKDSSISLPSLDMISGEISRMISSSFKGSDQVSIDSIVLSGGTAGLSNINEHLSAATGVRVVTGNPFGRVKYDPKLEPILKKNGTQFSVSVGLALKGVEKYLNNNKK